MATPIRPIAVVLACALLAAVASCGGVRGPALPDVLEAGSAADYTVSRYTTDVGNYNDATTSRDRVRWRDQIVFGVMGVIERNYRQFEIQFSSTRAGTATAGDVTELALGFATTVSMPTRVQSILGAALTGVKGSRLSLEKNFFRERTTEALIAAMQAAREGVREEILERLRNPDYGLYEARVDLTRLFYAGTLQSALQVLNEEATEQAARERESAAEAHRVLRVYTAEQYLNARQIRARIDSLFNEGDVEALRAALVALDEDVDQAAAQGLTLEQVYDRLLEILGERVDDPEQIQQFRNALGVDQN